MLSIRIAKQKEKDRRAKIPRLRIERKKKRRREGSISRSLGLAGWKGYLRGEKGRGEKREWVNFAAFSNKKEKEKGKGKRQHPSDQFYPKTNIARERKKKERKKHADRYAYFHRLSYQREKREKGEGRRKAFG